jgi:hypothetical protein
MIRHPIESDFYANTSESAVEVIFAPTRTRFIYDRLIDHKETIGLLSPSPIIRHIGRGGSGAYEPQEIQAMAYRVALATVRRLRRSAPR